MQGDARLAQDFLVVMGENDVVVVVEFTDDVAVLAQARAVQGGQHIVGVHMAHLDHRAQFLVEQDRRRILAQIVEGNRHAHMTGECHLAQGDQQAAVGAVVIGVYHTVVVEGLDDVEEFLDGVGVDHIGRVMAQLFIHLRQRGAAEAIVALA